MPPEISSRNILWALQEQTALLRNTSQSPLVRALALRFIIHLFGDLHEPMHCVTRVTEDHLKGDYGGNLYYIEDGRNWHVRNLHSLWDSGAGLYDSISRTDLNMLSDLAVELTGEFPPAALPEFVPGDSNFTGWAIESHSIAVSQAYTGIGYDGPVDPQYRAAAQATVRRRIALGGLRLSNFLMHTDLSLPSAPSSGSGCPSGPSAPVREAGVGWIWATGVLSVTCALLLITAISIVWKVRGKAPCRSCFHRSAGSSEQLVGSSSAGVDRWGAAEPNDIRHQDGSVELASVRVHDVAEVSAGAIHAAASHSVMATRGFHGRSDDHALDLARHHHGGSRNPGRHQSSSDLETSLSPEIHAQ